MDEVFGPFRLISLIARGGMAETFIGERTGPAGFVQRVCVKRILAAEQDDPHWIRLFKKEARIAGALRHANIAVLHDFGCEGGVWWMSFELIEGVTLRALMSAARCQGRRMPLESVLLVAAELAKALSYAHGRTGPDGYPAPVVHRDVTPTNVLVSGEGVVKLVDFGIATVLEKERTRTGRTGGKAGYMSPEQAHENQELYPVDQRTDLFSLGVVLFEALAGTRPFDGPTELMTKLNVSQGKKKDLRALAPETPEPLVRIVESLIETDVGARMASADALLDALSELPVRANVVRSLGASARAVRMAADEEAKEGATLLSPKPPTGWS